MANCLDLLGEMLLLGLRVGDFNSDMDPDDDYFKNG